MKTKLLFILYMCFSLSAPAQNAKQIANKYIPLTVSIIMEDAHMQPLSFGSGFIVDNGIVVTNMHVVAGAKNGYIMLSGSTTRHKISGYFGLDEKNDLVLLSAPTLKGVSINVEQTISTEIGDRIYAIGNPRGLAGTISEGIVSGIRDINNKKLIQITAPISPGSSGGPVFNNNGKLVGIAVSTIREGQNLNFAIPSSELYNLLKNRSNTAKALNIAKSPTKEFINIESGVKVSIPENKSIIHFLSELSVKNELPLYVSDIEVIVILYNRKGEVEDYHEFILFDSSDINLKYRKEAQYIRPYLTKKVKVTFRDFAYINSDTSVEIRVLSFNAKDYM